MNILRSIISSPRLPYLFYSVWILIALLQANFTELLSDEAYYWKYSQFLEWGYFDHPPMVALLIKIGSSLLSGELGVRLLFVLLGTSTICILERLTAPTNKVLFYIISSSIGLLYFTSVLALPDVPLLFYSALFFYLLKRYLNSPSTATALILGITIAGLLLSKYHGFVIILLALLSNLQLLKKVQFYVVILTAFLLVLPHFYWQLSHNFPSIQYHFHDRNLSAYNITYTLNFILVQLILFGPFIGLFLWISFFKTKIKTQFEKTLYRQVVGVLIFFFLLTFNGKAEGHWTSILVIPLIYFGYHYLSQQVKLRKWVYYQWPVSLFIIMIIKLGLSVNLPFGKQFNALFSDYKGNQIWAKTIQNATQEYPVIFMNSYQNAAKYEFYSGQPSITISNVMSRKNQYNLWHYEDSLRGQSVAIIPNYYVKEFDTIKGVEPIIQYQIVDNFQNYSQVTIEPLNWFNETTESNQLQVDLKLNHSEAFTFTENKAYPAYISYAYFDDNHFISQHRTELNCATLNRDKFTLTMELPKRKSTYQVYFCIKTGWLPAGLNSRVYELSID